MRKMQGGSFIFIIFLIFMVYNSVRMGRFDDPGQWLYGVLLLLPAIVVGITFHEFMHAYSAYKLGDQTPKVQGRVTLNPLKHIDPIGIIILIFVGFGWGKPVQVNPYAFKGNKRLANLIVNVAGVGMNFFLAVIFSGVVVALEYGVYMNQIPYSDPLGVFYSILIMIVRINLVLMLFNLLPVPPLDGFGIITEVFNLRQFSWHRQLYNNGMIILLFIVILPIFNGQSLVSIILGPALTTIPNALFSFWSAIIF
jgi:Zn-dependent protease